MNEQIDQERRTTLKIIGTTGLATAGVIGASGSAVAQQNPRVQLNDGGPSRVLEESTVNVEADEEIEVQQIIVEITDIDTNAETVDGTVTAVAPDRGQDDGSVRNSTDFNGVSVDLENPTQVLDLDIEDLQLDLLGLTVELDLFLTVEAREGEGLLGDLVAAIAG